MKPLLAFSWMLLLSGGSTEPALETSFTEVSGALGLNFVHRVATGFLMPEIMGSGAALFDYDQDGALDIYFIQAGDSLVNSEHKEHVNRLYRQREDGSFSDVTESSGLGDSGYGMGAAVGDIDNDGDLDVYVSNYGPDRLFLNDGKGRFEDITERAGIHSDGWSASAVFCDVDDDGYLDLYVTRYVEFDTDKHCRRDDGSRDYCGPQVFSGKSDLLYRNDGNGTFDDVSQAAGLLSVAAPGLGVSCADWNTDGRLDIYVANDGEANQVWINQGRLRFEDEAVLMGVALNDFGRAEAGMGIAIGDVEADGDQDLFLTHLRDETNTLYLNEGPAGFRDDTPGAGFGVASLARTGFGTQFLDYDHDGDLDLAVANGRVARYPPLPGVQMGRHWRGYAEPNDLFRNDGRGRFELVRPIAGGYGADMAISRGLSVGDIDNDGDLDIVVTNTSGAPGVYRNDSEKSGHWLQLRAIDPALNRDAYGSLVTVVGGGRSQTRIVQPGSSYLSSNDARIHFGVAGPTIERVEVLWPDGVLEIFEDLEVDRLVLLKKTHGIRKTE